MINPDSFRGHNIRNVKGKPAKMSEQPSPDVELTNRVLSRLAEELDLNDQQISELGEVIQAGKNQGQQWLDVALNLIEEENNESN